MVAMIDVEYLLNRGVIQDKRLETLLTAIVYDSKALESVSEFIYKYCLGELSENDLLIAINKYRAARSSLLGEDNGR